MPYKSFDERAAEMDAEFNTHFRKASRWAVVIGIFWAVVVLAVLGLAAYLVINLV